MKCPKCGYENRDDAHFCSECGADLSSEKFSCPKCGATVYKGNKHCSSCGKELSWVDVDYDSIPIPIKQLYKKPSQKQNQAKHSGGLLRYVLSGLLLVGVLLLFIGCFGDYAKGSVTSLSIGNYKESSSALTYYFKTVYSNIQDIQKTDQYGYVYSFELFLMVLDVIVYYSMFIIIATFAVLSTVNLIRALMNKDEINYVFLNSMIFTAILHIMVVQLVNFTAVYMAGEGYIKIALGWGSLLLLIGSILIFGCIMAERIVKPIINKGNSQEITGNSLTVFADILSFVLLLLTFGFIFVVKDTTNLIKMPLNPSFTLRYLLSLYNGNANYAYEEAYGLSVAGFFILLISTILYLGNFTINIKNYSLVKVILAGVFFAGILVGEFVLLSATSKSFNAEVGLNAGGAFIIICGLLSLGSAVAGYALKRN
jgi:hypothetical protein